MITHHDIMLIIESTNTREALAKELERFINHKHKNLEQKIIMLQDQLKKRGESEVQQKQAG